MKARLHLSPTWKGHIAILVANIIFGANILVVKRVMPSYTSALSIAFMRIAGACVLFWIASLFVKKEKVSLKDKGLILLASFFAVNFNQLYPTDYGFRSGIDSENRQFYLD